MDDEQVNGRRTARRAAAVPPVQPVMTEERPEVPHSADIDTVHDAGHAAGPGPRAATGFDSGHDAVAGPAMDRYTRRRLAAEAAADAAEAAAADAATRAAAAIKAAARAAEEAEAAADAAAQAADDALAAAEAEARAHAVRDSALPTPQESRGQGGHPVNGRPVNGRTVEGRPAGGPPVTGNPMNGRSGDRRDDTALIPPVRSGGRRHRYADDTTDDQRGPGADAAGGTVPAEAPGEVTAVVPAAREGLDARMEGRGARRRAQAAAAAAAEEASRDPATDVIDVPRPSPRPVHDAPTQIVTPRPRAGRDESGGADGHDIDGHDIDGRDDYDDYDEFDDIADEFDELGHDLDVDRDDEDRRATSIVRRDTDDEYDDEDETGDSWFGRPVVYAVGGVLLIIGLIAALVMVLGGGGTTATPAASSQPQPGSAGAPAAGAGAVADKVDPTSTKAVAFLDSLREGGITTSRSGISETQAAAGICNQLAQGVDASTLAKSLPTQLPTVAKKQASLFIDLVQKNYC